MLILIEKHGFKTEFYLENEISKNGKAFTISRKEVKEAKTQRMICFFIPISLKDFESLPGNIKFKTFLKG